MASEHILVTNAPQDDVVATFKAAFFTPASFSDFFRGIIDTAATNRRIYTWKQTTAPGAAIAAEIIRAKGVAESLASKNGKSQLGVTIALAFEDSNDATLAQVWTSSHHSTLGMNSQSGLLKFYVGQLRKRLSSAGFSVESHTGRQWAKSQARG